jgi:hypothetical protein
MPLGSWLAGDEHRGEFVDDPVPGHLGVRFEHRVLIDGCGEHHEGAARTPGALRVEGAIARTDAIAPNRPRTTDAATGSGVDGVLSARVGVPEFRAMRE